MDIKFLIKFFVMSLLLSVGTYFFLHFSEVKEGGWFWSALIYYVAIGLLIGWMTQRAINASNSAFFRGVLGATGIRMLLSIFFLAIYLIISDIKSKEFIVFYLILYLFYTIFEISQLVSKLRPEKNSNLDNATS